MDKIDHKILQILQNDADITNAALAERVHLAPSSCLRRVRRLKDSGAIKKTVCIIDEKVMGRNLKAIVDVVLERHGTQGQAAFHERVKNEAAISQDLIVTGERDVVLFMNVCDMEEYKEVCDRLFNFDKNVIRFKTTFVIKSLIE
jgi:Lrp/AsnC family transcriptional regulator, leucine-responsive regulatory protein